MFLTWLLVLFVGVLSRCARVRITERILTCLLKGISYLVVAKRWHWCGSIRQYVFLQVIDAQAVRQYEEAKRVFPVDELAARHSIGRSALGRSLPVTKG